MSKPASYAFNQGNQYRVHTNDGAIRDVLCVGTDEVEFETDDGTVIGVDMIDFTKPVEDLGPRTTG